MPVLTVKENVTKDVKAKPSLAMDPDQFDEGVRSKPYLVNFTIRGEEDLLMHRYAVESVESKKRAMKNSEEKKTDDIESYIYRMPDGTLGIDTCMIVKAISESAKSLSDPRSPRKSAADLYNGGIRPVGRRVPLYNKNNVKTKDWDYIDTRRVRVQQAAVPRSRPAILAGWRVDFTIRVILPQYIDARTLRQLIVDAGPFGLADGRKIGFGMFHLESFEVVLA